MFPTDKTEEELVFVYFYCFKLTSFICMSVLCVHHVHASPCPQATRGLLMDPLGLQLQMVVSPYVSVGIHPDPLRSSQCS